jgi:hypothetical protein
MTRPEVKELGRRPLGGARRSACTLETGRMRWKRSKQRSRVQQWYRAFLGERSVFIGVVVGEFEALEDNVRGNRAWSAFPDDGGFPST